MMWSRWSCATAQPVAHPGLASVKLRRTAADLVDCRALGSPASSDALELRYVLDAVRAPLPLTTFCVLDQLAGWIAVGGGGRRARSIATRQHLQFRG